MHACYASAFVCVWPQHACSSHVLDALDALRAKKSVVLDLKTAAHREALELLIGEADVFLSER